MIRSLYDDERVEGDDIDPGTRLIGADRMKTLANKIRSMASGGGETSVRVNGWWHGELRWARNRVVVGSDRRNVQVTVIREFDFAGGAQSTNQFDDDSLREAVRAAERLARVNRKEPAPDDPPSSGPIIPSAHVSIWSDATFAVTAAQRGALAQTLTEQAEARGFLSAGYIEMRASEFWDVPTDAEATGALTVERQYQRHTQAQCSTTVRHPNGIGSGWAGLTSYEWNAIDPAALAARALRKCEMSLNPVGVEPGRYTVILESQAVADLMSRLLNALDRQPAERGNGPFSADVDRQLQIYHTKLGQQIIDPRITISHDPSDPSLGVVPRSGLAPITWIDHGVLRMLSYERHYAIANLQSNDAQLLRSGYRMSGGTTTIDEMIETTERGILVTRFSGTRLLDEKSMLMTGTTRDGLWLIEHGKISKAIKNMRFTDSPLFVLNNVDQLGVPMPVFQPMVYGDFPVFVPPIKAKDFNFMMMIDAV